MNLDKMRLDSMIDMFLNCKIQHSYMIFVKRKFYIKEIVNYLQPRISDVKNLRITISCNQATLTNLDSGAIIRIVLADKYTRGYRSFLSLYEDASPQEIIDYIIRPISLMSLSFNMDRLLESEE